RTSACGRRVWSIISTTGRSGVASGASQIVRIGLPATFIVFASRLHETADLARTYLSLEYGLWPAAGGRPLPYSTTIRGAARRIAVSPETFSQTRAAMPRK